MRKNVLSTFVVLVSLFGAMRSDGTTIEEASRSLVVSTFVDASGVISDSSAGGASTGELGGFLDAVVDGTGVGGIVVATGEATQTSSIDLVAEGGLFVEAGGAAGVLFDVQDPGFPSRATGNADSRLSLIFDLDEERPFALSVSLEADLDQLSRFAESASATAGVRSFARLSGSASGIVFDAEVADETAGDGASFDDFASTGILLPDTYLLELGALAELRGFENAAGFGTSGFGASLRVIPEPGTAMMVGFGLALMSRRSARPALRRATRCRQA